MNDAEFARCYRRLLQLMGEYGGEIVLSPEALHAWEKEFPPLRAVDSSGAEGFVFPTATAGVPVRTDSELSR